MGRSTVKLGAAIAAGAAVGLMIAEFLPYFRSPANDETFSFWEVSSRLDVMVLVASLAVLALAVVTLTTGAERAMVPAIALGGFNVAGFLFWDQLLFEEYRIGAWFGLLCALAMTGAAILATLALTRSPVAAPVAAPGVGPIATAAGVGQPVAAAAGAGAAAGGQASAQAPAGWYPDPNGGAGQRYWNGEAWV